MTPPPSDQETLAPAPHESRSSNAGKVPSDLYGPSETVGPVATLGASRALPRRGVGRWPHVGEVGVDHDREAAGQRCVAEGRKGLLVVHAPVDGGRPVLPPAGIVGRREDLEGCRGTPDDRAAGRLTVVVAHVESVVVDARHVPVPLADGQRHAPEQPVPQRPVCRGGQVGHAVVAELHPHASARFGVRPPGVHRHGSANRVAPEERPLRSAQHLDAFHVDEVHHRSHRARHVYPVDVDRNTGIRHRQEVTLPHAPDVELRRGFRARESAGVVEVDVRQDLAEQIGRSDLAKLQIATGQGRHRQRDALKELLPVPGGHDQRLQPDNRVGVGWGILGPGGRHGGEKCSHHGSNDQESALVQ